MVRMVALIALAGCGRIGFDATADASSDASGDAPPDVALPLGPWSVPVPIPGANTGMFEEDPTGNSTKTELIFSIDPTGGSGIGDLFVMNRATDTDAWGAPQPITELTTPSTESTPRLSPDDLTLFFQSNRAGSMAQDVWTTTRTAVGQPWGTASNVTYANTGLSDKWLTVCAGGRYLMVRTTLGAADEIYEGIMPGAPSVVPELNTTGDDNGTFVSPDCLSVYFVSKRGGTDTDLFEAHRSSATDGWGAPVRITELSVVGANETDPWISADGRLFVFASNRNGNPDLFMATR